MYLSKLQRDILHLLINKYESRSDYGKTEKNTRRTMITVNRVTFPLYFHDTDSQYKVNLNKDMQELQENHLVVLEWGRFSKGEELARIIVNDEKLIDLYHHLGIQSKEEKYKNTLKVVKDYARTASILLEAFYQHVEGQLVNLKSIPSIIDLDSLENTHHQLRALHTVLESRDFEISKRRLSIQLFNDSKKFESIESKIISVLQKYVYSEQELTGDDILSELGVIDKLQSINVFGSITFEIQGQTLDLSLFDTSFGLDTKFIENASISDVKADRIVTVENLTSFYDYIHYVKKNNKNYVVVYLGGFHNSLRRLLLEKILKFMKWHNMDITFNHWGDIDLGGIRIWKHLSSKLNISITPIFMDIDTYTKYIAHGKKIETKGYLDQLKKLLEDPSFKEFHDLINLILQNERTVEQEIVLISDE
ncbi:Wadjet anti-phage system protein JetD domain-containing protein [Neobacillus sp. NPDC093127]|uniref:Wadjet anti-phage system protein JetD domain-containing protein n=1 Tax=Neobacillus sp. NPDC093127 TaxID=3364296 RepID=UPI00380A5E23